MTGGRRQGRARAGTREGATERRNRDSGVCCLRTDPATRRIDSCSHLYLPDLVTVRTKAANEADTYEHH